MTLLATHNTGISSCGPSFEAYEVKAPLVTITCSQRAGKIKRVVSSVQQLEDVALINSLECLSGYYLLARRFQTTRSFYPIYLCQKHADAQTYR